MGLYHCKFVRFDDVVQLDLGLPANFEGVTARSKIVRISACPVAVAHPSAVTTASSAEIALGAIFVDDREFHAILGAAA